MSKQQGIDTINILLLLAILASCSPAIVPCDTDTDCLQKNGGDGGPAPQ